MRVISCRIGLGRYLGEAIRHKFFQSAARTLSSHCGARGIVAGPNCVRDRCIMLAATSQPSSLVYNLSVESHRGSARSPFIFSPVPNKASVLKNNCGASGIGMVRKITASAAPWSGIVAAAATSAPASAVGLTVIRDGVSTEVSSCLQFQ